MPKVLLIGVGATTPTALQSLLDSCTVLGVVRAVDAAAASDPVVELAAAYGVPIFGDTSVASLRALVASLMPDCVVVSSYDRILPADLLATCRFVNVHYAPLPRFRGRANVNWAIITGQPTAAITVHVLDRELDAGNILFQHAVPIKPGDTVSDLYAQLNALQRRFLGEAIVRHLAGDPGQPQDHARATYGCTRLPEDGEIDWHATSAAVDALVRALTPPFPGAFTHFGGKRLIVWRAAAVDGAPVYEGRIPGRVVSVSRVDGYVDVLAGDGVVRLFEVEVDAGVRVPAAAVVRSVRATLGLRSGDLLARLDALEREVAHLRRHLMTIGEQHAHA
jgi:methionyl-tRNA formyltransferase